jgi:hypothetical protein
MRYATYASIRRSARRPRLERLLEALARYGCTARIEAGRRRMVLELPEDDFEWIVTGGLAELLASFEDCLAWERSFFEARLAGRARLPAPDPGAEA